MAPLWECYINLGYGKHVAFWPVRADLVSARRNCRVPQGAGTRFTVLGVLSGGRCGAIVVCRRVVCGRLADGFVRQFVDDHCALYGVIYRVVRGSAGRMAHCAVANALFTPVGSYRHRVGPFSVA